METGHIGFNLQICIIITKDSVVLIKPSGLGIVSKTVELRMDEQKIEEMIEPVKINIQHESARILRKVLEFRVDFLSLKPNE